MTPKEKAIDLVDAFKVMLIMSDSDVGEELVCTALAKEIAIRAIREIIKSRDNDHGFDDRIMVSTSKYASLNPLNLSYWIRVMEEIAKL